MSFMRIFVAGGLLAASLGTVAVAVASDHGSAPAAAGAEVAAPASPTWMPLAQLTEVVSAMGYTEITEIERERSTWEVKARDRDGNLVELKLHPTTGELLGVERKR